MKARPRYLSGKGETQVARGRVMYPCHRFLPLPNQHPLYSKNSRAFWALTSVTSSLTVTGLSCKGGGCKVTPPRPPALCSPPGHALRFSCWIMKPLVLLGAWPITLCAVSHICFLLFAVSNAPEHVSPRLSSSQPAKLFCQFVVLFLRAALQKASL